MLTVEHLTVAANETVILNDVSFTIPEGETHILLGPNGSGKSTLIKAILGLGDLKVKSGRILFQGVEINGLSIDERARLGIGIAMQRPPVLPEVSLKYLADLLAKKYHTDWSGFAGDLNCEYLLERGLNHNFSGGETKRAELLQLMIQKPSLLLVDEPESGVDLENISLVGKALYSLLKGEKVKKRDHSGLIITHTGHILDYINADKGYIMVQGRLVCEGNPRDLFQEITKYGFEGCIECTKYKKF